MVENPRLRQEIRNKQFRRGKKMVSKPLCNTFVPLLLTVAMPVAASAAVALPSDGDVTGIVKMCAVGRVQTIQGDVEGKIQIWKRQAEAKGNASLADLGAILNTISTGQQISPDVYKVYTDCIKSNIEQFIKADAPKPDPHTNVCASNAIVANGNMSGTFTNTTNGGTSTACTPPGKS
jgi:hypothetical protein